MRVYKAHHFADAYYDLLRDLIHRPEHVCSPRGLTINEIMNAVIEIHPDSNMYSNPRRSSQYKYIAAELVWYFMGRNDVGFIEKYAKFWANITNPDGTLNSAYGNLIFTKINEHGYNQWGWAYKCLSEDKDSRQAIMHFNMPEHQYHGNKDFVCTLNAVFHIRDNKLNLTVFMRSNDAILGLPTDVGFFTILQKQMLNLLKAQYPELELGVYTHQAASMHLYDRNFELVKEMLKEQFKPEYGPNVITNLVDEHGVPTEAMISLERQVETGQFSPTSLPSGDCLGWIKDLLSA